MTKEPITFDKLPQAVNYLTEQERKFINWLKPYNHRDLIISIN